ncbi:MAG: glycosyltransferase family 2 protein [Candidatus Micrarchaeia archaeon]
MEKQGSVMLSICIPTYNRPECIERSLSNLCSIIRQAGLSEKVEVCVSDNSDGGAMRPIVEKFSGKGAMVSYFAWGRNAGYDKNALKALSIGKGRFLHLNSDEITHSSEAIERLVSYLEGVEEDSCLVLSLAPGPRMISPEKEPLSRFVSVKGIAKPFGTPLTRCVVSRRVFESFMAEHAQDIEKRFIGSSFVHLPLFIYALAGRAHAYYAALKPEDAAKSNVSSKPSAALPSDNAKLYAHRLYSVYLGCHESGILPEREFALFRRNFSLALPLIALRIRIMVPPFMASSQLPLIASYVDALEAVPATERWLVKFLVLNKFVPYHFAYLAFYYYKKKIRKDKEILNLFDLYSGKKESSGFHFS